MAKNVACQLWRGPNWAQWSLVLVLLVGFVGLISYLCLSSMNRPDKFDDIVSEFPAGTPADQVMQRIGKEVRIEETRNKLPFEPTEEEKRRYVFYYVQLPEADAEIQFNFYRTVIRVERLSELREPR